MQVPLQHRLQFDSTRMLPLRHKQTRKDSRIIELTETVSGRLLVCFRGTYDAAQALGLKPRDLDEVIAKYREKVDMSNF
eukprot:CAMPEP_0118719058 /NCGR_PEP_ID=MMETSP0800-20121206/29195_1 /TAXON_ID=210618 ORGANISM="Striatella unipunctata, Strain CCMP2910" /NCGR_SAMPLE_ID=MMETSP0800 /ASSEMBLY_ACC=CAM_ASM_000638 /LENGTH=78 /DNA_ID=CAMNT_0006626247 /DNA_START=120 /DNA_END=356 /DNA_ORIENTATION=+